MFSLKSQKKAAHIFGNKISKEICEGAKAAVVWRIMYICCIFAFILSHISCGFYFKEFMFINIYVCNTTAANARYPISKISSGAKKVGFFFFAFCMLLLFFLPKGIMLIIFCACKCVWICVKDFVRVSSLDFECTAIIYPYLLYVVRTDG